MRNPIIWLSAATFLTLGACDAPAKEETQAAHTAASATTAAEIAWRDGDVEEAFTEASEAGKPVLLYWGAVWCPPCNVLKATLFHDPEFVARTQDFVPVYLDGDSDGAQRWGEHFAIQGYPTLILLRPDKTEITRLSGSGDADEISQALRAVQAGQATAAQIVAKAQTDAASITADEWSIISAYGWEVDLNRLVAADRKASVLNQLAKAAPDEALQRRFALLALEADAANEAAQPASAQQAEIRALLAKVLADPQEVKRNRWTLIYSSADLIKRAGGSADERKVLETSLIASLDGLQSDATVSLGGRLNAVNADIDVHHLNAGEKAAPPKALLEKVRQRVAWADEQAKTPYERQAILSDAAYLLQRAGDLAGAETLLTAELKRSATPFYYMPDLAGLAEERGDKAKALDWWRQGYETSTGSASRIQWGILYVQNLIRLTPKDTEAVETAATRIIDELKSHPDSYHQRTRMRFEGLQTDLVEWSAANKGSKVLEQLRARMHDVCPAAQSDEEARSACNAWLAKV